jgi:hypothetical protein
VWAPLSLYRICFVSGILLSSNLSLKIAPRCEILKNQPSLLWVAHTCNPNYMGGWAWEALLAGSSHNPISTNSWLPMVHICHPSNLGGWAGEDLGSRPAQAKVCKTLSQLGVGASGVGVGEELGVVAHTCHPRYSGGWDRDYLDSRQPRQKFGRPHLNLWLGWWCLPVIPPTVGS